MLVSEGNRVRRIKVGSHRVTTSEVFRSYWTFAAERQRVYHARLGGSPGPWTDDPVISRFRFTNAYRAADRVSQDLIRVAYAGSQDPGDLLLRILVYRFFNKPSTWRALEATFGELNQEAFDIDAFSVVLDQMLARGERVYSAAYIVPPPPFGATRKHRNHLLLIEHMMTSNLAAKVSDAPSMKAVFELIASYPSLGPFLAYQLTVDLNYTSITNFDENDFVVAGPGAKSGIAKCFPDLDGLSPEGVIRWMVETQHDQFSELGLSFQDLFGRRLALIDCQNLFCETDKYARVMHPDIRGVGNRTRIKQQFSPVSLSVQPFFPPKWGINQNILIERAPADVLF
jgi:hypothetical protein